MRPGLPQDDGRADDLRPASWRLDRSLMGAGERPANQHMSLRSMPMMGGSFGMDDFAMYMLGLAPRAREPCQRERHKHELRNGDRIRGCPGFGWLGAVGHGRDEPPVPDRRLFLPPVQRGAREHPLAL